MPFEIFGQGPDWSRKGLTRGLQLPTYTGDFLRDAVNRLGQNTFMTPDQFSNLFRQLTAPAEGALAQNYGGQMRNLGASYANRGNLFGGSLTGAQAQAGQGYQQALSNLYSNVGGQLGQTDLQLGAQRQLAAQNLLNQFIQAILGGNFGLMQAQLSKPSGFGATLGGLGSLLSGVGGLFGGLGSMGGGK